MAVVEYALGMTCNLDYSVWDYRNQPFNIAGQVCLVYSLLFGVAATLVTWLIYPLLEGMFSYVTQDVFNIIFVAAPVLFLLLVFTYNINLDNAIVTQNLVDDGVLRMK